MKKDDADQVIEEIRGKENVTKKDLVRLLLTPLMSGTMSIKERIKAGFTILYHRESGVMDPMEVRKMEAVMYAMANKFVSKEDLEEIKEAADE